MKAEYGEHPLGTPGLSARRVAGPAPWLLRLASSLFPGLARTASSWEKGAVGEEAAAKVLAKLPRDRWMVLHDRSLGRKGRNVDHLVIGPGGVFSVNTKNLSGDVVVTRNAFLVNGSAEKHLHVARDEGRRVSERLSSSLDGDVDVVPVIAVFAPTLDIQDQPEGVRVLDARELARWFAAQPQVLDPGLCSNVYFSARREATWGAPVVAGGLTTKVWTRWGLDRVYVNDIGGRTLGHLDRQTGEIHVADGASEGGVRAALAPFEDRR